MSVFCPCREPRELGPGSIPSLLEHPECYFAPNDLLFCATCRAVRCPYCTIAEPLVWYCARCFAESTKTQARAAFNTCTRNCVRCPRCYAGLKTTQEIQSSGSQSSEDQHSEDSATTTWTIDCPRCEYHQTLSGTHETVSALCRELRRRPLEDVAKWVGTALGPDPHAQKTRMLEDLVFGSIGRPAELTQRADPLPLDAVPLLAPLRAKCLKKCAQCRGVLAEPKLASTDVGFVAKSTARSHLPLLMLRDGKLVLRSFAAATLRVRLAVLDESIDLGAVEVDISPPSATGFPAPLWLVERESVASRQAFMNQKAPARAGPGWALVDLGVPAGLETLYLYLSLSANDEPIGAWYRIPLS